MCEDTESPTEVVSKQSPIYSNTREDKNDLRAELPTKRKQNFMIWKLLSVLQNTRRLLRKSTKGPAKRPL